MKLVNFDDCKYIGGDIVNLIISNMNNDIKMDEIIDNKLITVSIQKAKTHKLVCNKLKELILENNRSLEDKQYESSIRYNTDFNEDNSVDILDIVQIVNYVLSSSSQFLPNFTVEDINPASEYFGQVIGPETFSGDISCYYL